MSGGEEGGATKTGAGWAQLFAELGLAQALARDGYVDVAADDIKRIAGREPRLMTKFDTREARPIQLKQVTILAIRNGVYRLVAGDGYLDLPKRVEPSSFRIRRTQLQTLTIDCVSESQVLDLAYATGILQHFVGERRMVLTGRGRRRCKRFQFVFDGATSPQRLIVTGVQIEVDGGYEGDAIYVVEAKIGLRDNFLIRQLYYPYRMWQADGVTKPIVPIFVCYSNRQVVLYQYNFTDPESYHSIELVKSAAYSLDPAAQLPTFAEILQRTLLVAEPLGVPFPQADDLRRVIDVIDAVAAGVCSRPAITERNDFASRQAGYYAEAARYLGFIERSSRGEYQLTRSGRDFVRASQPHRISRVAEVVASRPALRVIIADARAEAPLATMVEHLHRLRPEISGSTLARRVQTARRWNAWLEASLGEPQLVLADW